MGQAPSIPIQLMSVFLLKLCDQVLSFNAPNLLCFGDAEHKHELISSNLVR